MANNTTTKTIKTTEAIVAAGAIQKLDFKPKRMTGGRRPKSELRVQIEALEIGESIFTGLVVEGVSDDTRDKIMGSVRSKTQAITKEDPTKRFSVYAAAEVAGVLPAGAVIVERVEATATDSE